MTNKAKQLAVRMETYAKFPYLIEITFWDKNDNKIVERYANCEEDITFEDYVYKASFFKIKPPSRSNSEISDGTLTYSTIDQSWIQKIRDCKHRAKIRFLACIIYNEDNNVSMVEKIDDMKFTLTKCVWNERTVRWTMMFDDRMNLIIPVDSATFRKVPALA